MRNLKFGSEFKLKYFCKSNCCNKTLDIDIPQSLTEVSVFGNDFLEVPLQLVHLEILKVLEYRNFLEKINIEFLNNSLEVIDLSYDSIEKLQLKFPDGDTKFKQLNLNLGELPDITIESIGDRDKTKHSSLLSIRFENKKITEYQILALIPKFLKSRHELRAYKKSHGMEVNHLSKK